MGAFAFLARESLTLRYPERVVATLEPTGVTHFYLDGRQHFFPHTRHADEQGRLYFQQVSHQRIPTTPKVHAVCHRERKRRRQRALEYVTERQVRQQIIVGRSCEGLAPRPSRRKQVGVGEHCAFRWAGRARGVDDNRHSIHVERINLRPECADRTIRTGFQQRIERDHVAGCERIVCPSRFDNHDVPELRQSITHLQQLVELFLVVDDGECATGVIENVFNFGRGTCSVHSHNDGPDALGTNVAPQPFRTVVPEDGNTVTTRHSQRTKRESHARRAIRVFAPGVLTPPTEVLVAERYRVGFGDGIAPQQGGHRFNLARGQRRAVRDGQRGHVATPRYASITAAFVRTSAGTPTVSTRPKSIAITRCARSMTKCMSCSTSNMATCSSSLISRM